MTIWRHCVGDIESPEARCQSVPPPKRPLSFVIAPRPHVLSPSTTYTEMASSTPHKARKKRKDISSNGTASTSNSVLITHNKTEAAAPAFPLVSFLWPARGSTSQWVTLPLILMVVGLFRWTTGHWGYSGRVSTGLNKADANRLQASIPPICSVISRRKDIGWK